MSALFDGPRIWSKRAGAPEPPPGAVLVDRTTVWGNPFVVGVDGPRGECVRLHREWALRDTPEGRNFREHVRRMLRGKDLVCWCAPKACHATALMDIANSEEKDL